MLLAVSTHEEGGDVHNLLAHADVPLADEHARVVDRLGEAELEDLGLQAALEEVGGLERQHVVELRLLLVEHAEAQQPAATQYASPGGGMQVAAMPVAQAMPVTAAQPVAIAMPVN